MINKNKVSMRKDQYKQICEWQKKIFTDATPLSCAKHLREEAQELIDDLESENINLEEVADCFLTLIGVCNMLGLNYETITSIIDDKMKTNFKRKWKKTDQGYMKHVKS